MHDETVFSWSLFGLGSSVFAVIKLSDIKDWAAIAVAATTIVCMLYTTFWLSRKNNKKET